MRLGSSLLILLAAASTAPRLHAQAWDPAPLRSPTPTPKDGLPPGRSEFFAWLQTSALTPQENQKARERIYTYISAEAKRLGGAFPPVGDTAATSLFQHAAQLGVAGADRVVDALMLSTSSPKAVPAGVTLAFKPPLFSLSSADSAWAFCYPWYFMAVPGGRQAPNSGIPTEVAVLSTLAATDSGTAGSSQATILFVAAGVTDSARHVNFWLKPLKVNPVPTPPGMPGQWFSGDLSEPMRREALVVRLPARVIVIAYIGLQGTFETNRPHFLNFLRTLAPGRCAG